MSLLQQVHTSNSVHVETTQLNRAVRFGAFDAARWLCETAGLALDERHATIAWVAQRQEMEPFFPAGFRPPQRLATLAAVVGAPSSFPVFGVALRHHFSKEDAAEVTVEQRVRLLHTLLHRRHVENLQWLLIDCGWSLDGVNLSIFRVGDNSVQILDLLKEKGVVWASSELMGDAMLMGRLDVIEWLHKHGDGVWHPSIVRIAAECGHLHIVQWSHNNLDFVCGPMAMNAAAGGGHIYVLQWLQLNRSDGCSESAEVWAAENGHVDAIAWLHRNRSEWDGNAALKVAVWSKSNWIVEYLLENKLTTRSLVDLVSDAVEQRDDCD